MSVYNMDLLFRRYYKMKIKEFCEKYNLSQATGRNYFHDRALPLDLAIQVAEDYNLSLDHIYRYKLNDEIIRKGDPSYVDEKTSEDDEKINDLNDPAAKAMMKKMIREVMMEEKNKEENGSSKAS